MSFVSKTRAEVPKFVESYQAAVQSVAQLAVHRDDFFTGSTKEDIENQLRDMADVLDLWPTSFGATVQAFDGLRAIIAASPRISAAMNRARRAATEALTELVREFNAVSALAPEAAANIRAMLSNKGSNPEGTSGEVAAD